MPLNRSRELLRATVIDTALCVALYAIGLRAGPVGVTLALAVGSATIRLPVAFWLATRRGPVPMRLLFTAIVPSMAATAGVAAAVLAVRRTFPLASDTASATGYVATVPAAIAIAVIVFALFPSSREVLASLLRLPRFFLGRLARET